MVIHKDEVRGDEDLGFMYSIILNEQVEYPSDIDKSFLVFRDSGEDWFVIEDDVEVSDLVFSSKHLHEVLNFLFVLEESLAREEDGNTIRLRQPSGRRGN